MKKISSNKYITGVNEAINHIEKHFSEKISLKKLADISGFSPFHFLRIFSAFVGETPNAFIKRVREEKVAGMLAMNQELSITQIAMKCGYSSSQTMARDFKLRFGMTPKEYRNSNIRNIYGNKTNALRITLPYDISKGRKSFKTMNVTIENISTFKVAYIRHIGSFKGINEVFDSAFEKLCGWAGPRGLINQKTLFLSAYYDDPKITNEDKMRIDICLSLDDKANMEPEHGINVMTVPGGKYAIYHTEVRVGDVKGFEDSWSRFYNEWLPTSGFEPDNRPSLEIYRNDPKEDKSGKFVVDICVAIK